MEDYKQKLKDFLIGISFDYEEDMLDLIVSNLFFKYCDSGRHYHTVYHIKDCLTELEQLEMAVDYFELPVDFSRLKLAIWYHDVEDNEEDSIKYFCNDFPHAIKMTGYEIDSEIESEVIRLINATKPDTKPKDIYQKLIKDIDCSILGKKIEVFKDYENKVRLEYPQYSDKEFCEGRSKILKAFLSRESIYYTRYFRDRYERQARQNLAVSIEHLEKGECIWNVVS